MGQLMGLSSKDIELLLLDGFGCSSGDREFVAKLDPKSDNVIINETTRLARGSLPLDYVLDQAKANESGSDVADVAALRLLLGSLAVRAI